MVIGVDEGPGHGHQQFFLADQGHGIVDPVDAPEGEGYHQCCQDVENNAVSCIMPDGKEYGSCAQQYIDEGEEYDIYFRSVAFPQYFSVKFFFIGIQNESSLSLYLKGLQGLLHRGGPKTAS